LKQPPSEFTKWDAAALRREAYEARKLQLKRRRLRLALASSYPLGLVIAGVVLVLIWYPDTRDELAKYAVVGLLGGSVGLGELVSRYRDAPRAAILTTPAFGYIALNAFAAVAALFLIFEFDWRFGATGDSVVPTQLLVASFGSVALFRTSLFTVRAGNEDVGIGPNSLLSVVLGACDRAVDRIRAKDRGFEVAYIMGNVSFRAAEGPLPAVALALMQNLPEAESIALITEVERLRHQSSISDEAKALLLGLAITNRVGTDVLETAKESLGPEILREVGSSEELRLSDLTALARGLDEDQSRASSEDVAAPPTNGASEAPPTNGPREARRPIDDQVAPDLEAQKLEDEPEGG